MSAQAILRRRRVRQLYGDPPASTFAYWRKVGRIPPPDVLLGDKTPGWFESTIERHQKEIAKAGIKRAARKVMRTARGGSVA
jgi:hypothetical protein